MMRRGLMAALIVAGGLAAACRTAPSTGVESTAVPSTPEPIVRVLIDDSRTEIVLQARGGWRVEDGQGSTLRAITGDEALKLTATNGKVSIEARDEPIGEFAGAVALVGDGEESRLGIAKIPYGVGWWWEGKEDRTYEGRVEFRATESGNLSVIGVLPIERYLLGVVPSEIGSGAPLEAMKAQAVAARSETVIALRTRKYAGDDYDICSDVNCQAYSGATKRTADTDAAVAATRGMILTYHGEPAGAYYASNCGGHSEDSTSVWPGRHPGAQPEYWSGTYDGDARPDGLDLTTEEGAAAWIAQPREDAWCSSVRDGLPAWAKKNYRWERTVDADDVTTMLMQQTKTDIGRVVGIDPNGRGVSGRLQSVVVRGESGSVTLDPELTIRRIVVPPLKSSCFVVEPVIGEGGDPARPEAFVFRGAGYGHGVGMCQTGAMGMALAGRDYEEILKHYYRGVEVEPAY